MGSTVGAFLLAMLICSCQASLDKEFSFSFLPDDEGEQGMPSKESMKQDKEEVDARDLQTQMLSEAKKVEEAVKRLGSLSSSDKNEKQEEGVVVSKAGALLLCSLYPEKSQMPEYCEGAKVGEGEDEDNLEKKKKDEISVSSRGVSEESGTKEEKPSALLKEIITKSTNKPKLLAFDPHRRETEPESDQLTLVQSWLRKLGFMQAVQGERQSFGIPVGIYQTPSPAWYYNQQHGSPYQPYHLQHPGLHLQQPAQHLHLHLPESTQLSSTNPDCQPGNFFTIEGKKYFLCQSGSDATGEEEEGAKSRQKRNSMLTWPFPTKVWPSSFSLEFPLPHYLFNPFNLNFNPFNPNLPKINFQLLSRGNPAQLPLWQQTAPGRGNKFSSSLAYQPSLANFYRPRFGSTLPNPTTDQPPASSRESLDAVEPIQQRRRPSGFPPLGCIPQPIHSNGGITYYKCIGDNRPLPSLVQDLSSQANGLGEAFAHIFAFAPEQRSLQVRSAKSEPKDVKGDGHQLTPGNEERRRWRRSLLTDVATTYLTGRAVSAVYDYLTSEDERATLEPLAYSYKPTSRYNYDRGQTTITTLRGPWRYTGSSHETKRCPWGECFRKEGF